MQTDFKKTAALIGDPIRATILWELTAGRPMTATELACSAETTQQNISNHLTKLMRAGLVVAASEGRHRYYQIAKWEAAYLVEALTLLMNPPVSTSQSDMAGPNIKYCRICYDHLAGEMGVTLTEALVRQKLIRLEGPMYALTRKGKLFFEGLGIDIETLKNRRRAFARACLDWTHKRYHLAGSLGAAILDHLLALDHIRKVKYSRALVVTAKGQKELGSKWGLRLSFPTLA